ncbi:MAG: glutathione peroxidase [Planctomycetaceae bacterium]|nr:glutathione peroxidase [Planctomycetaceae bacterium]
MRRTGAPKMPITARITAAVAGIALSVSGAACTQSMPVTDDLKEKWSDKTLFDIETKTLEGKPLKMSEWKGKAVLVVNVASKCGFTGQYEGLEKLSDQWKDKGLVVVGVPCNDFGGQEPGSASTIRQFCTSRFQVEFPMLEKQSTKPGKNQSQIFEYLGTRTGKLPGWNFCKYLVYPDGKTIEFYDSRTAPDGKKLEAKVKDAVSKVKVEKTAKPATEESSG